MFYYQKSFRRMFSSTVSAGATKPIKGMVGRVLGVVAAAGAGGYFYDFLSHKNLQKLSESIDADSNWDDDWDRYVRVPTERQDEIKSWFVAPDAEIVRKREQYDRDNNIGKRDIIMVRHGQYVTEEEGYGNLTPLGMVQAKATGERLKKILADRKVRIIYHSDMPRAVQTAAEIAKQFPGVEIRETPLLAEAVPVEPDPPSSNCPEYIPDEGKRLESAYRSFFAKPTPADESTASADSVDILIGHGNCFRFFVCRALQIDPRYWLRMAIYNCGISWVEIHKSGRISLRGVGDIGHIDKVTYS
jgi:broad specificity phosphatase PhoE